MFNVSSFKLITQRFSNRIDLLLITPQITKEILDMVISDHRNFFLISSVFASVRLLIFFLITDHLKSAYWQDYIIHNS